jgi:hypothetical protein
LLAVLERYSDTSQKIGVGVERFYKAPKEGFKIQALCGSADSILGGAPSKGE